MEIGEKVKQLRIQYGLTQEELASRCELSKGFISMLENDLTSPSLSTMQDLLEVFGLTLSDFFSKVEEEEENVVVYNKNDYFIDEHDDYKIDYLVADAQVKEIEPLKFTLNKNGKTDEILPHEGDMFGYVLYGEIELHVNDKKYLVKAGDSFYYSKPMTKQYIKNVSTSKSEFLWISTPPLF
ncbi:MAG: helix-turn-helix domain-containing protein [Bacilli bacterium]